MTETGFFCPSCETVYTKGIMACKGCNPKEYAKMADPVREILALRKEWASEAIYELETVAHAAEAKTLPDLACALIDHIMIIGEVCGAFERASELYQTEANQLKKRVEELEKELKNAPKKVQLTMFREDEQNAEI